MTSEELQAYQKKLSLNLTLDRHVERRFTALEDGDVPADMDLRFRGMLRDREPALSDILKHPRILILAEPGGGKSVIARAVALQFSEGGERVPILIELKEYRGDLAAMITKAAPAALLDPDAKVDGTLISRAYVLDGVDEIPRGRLSQLAADLEHLFEKDPNAATILTARQAFYAAHRDALSSVTTLFHILDFSDKDVAEYLHKSNVNEDAFLNAVRAADASEEIRNPFILSVMVEKYRDEGALSNRRSENLSYMIDQLIQSRKRVNRHQQHRALRMLGVALETYSRNELTEEEALGVIKQAMRVSDEEAHALLDELYASILKRTANGLAFQMRSYGEYLAAEELENQPLDRVKELAFIDLNTPNETWVNAMSYLLELNPQVRAYFVRRYPLWAISSSPAVFSDLEKAAIVKSALDRCIRDKQYLVHHPLINGRRLSSFLTDDVIKTLVPKLHDQDEIVRGSVIALLGIKEYPEVLPVALDVVKNTKLGVEIRYCAIAALVNVGGPEHVAELLEALDHEDPLHVNFLDMIGAIIDESQIDTVLPLILRENAMLSAAYYHFREFKSRAALVAMFRYFLDHPGDLNTIRAEGYVEPVFELLSRFFDAEVAELCADLLETIERLHIYPDQSGPLPKLFALMRETDSEGKVSRVFLERVLRREREAGHRIYYVDQLVVSLITPDTARWLVEQEAAAVIREIAPYSHGEIREIFRPYSGGVIDAQDVHSKAYREEEAQRQETRVRHVKSLQESLLSRTSLNDALKDLWELKQDYWPELPDGYRDWLAHEVSKALGTLELEKSIQWKENTLWEPNILSFLMKIVDRFVLRIEPDEPLVFAITGMDEGVVARYHKRFPLSDQARTTLERLLTAPPSTQALGELVRFVETSGIWSDEVFESLKNIVSSTENMGYLQVTAMNLLVKHNIEREFIHDIANKGASQDLRTRAFDVLIEGQDRPTIERALAIISDAELQAGNARIPDMSPLAWIAKIKGDFAWDKLVDLRARALGLQLPMLVGLITEALARIDRTKAAGVIRRQADIAPESWRVAQIAQAIDQERSAKIEAAQRTPFEEVLRKLKGSTSINRLKVLSEGTSDRPVLKSLIEQIGETGDIIFDSVGGWGGLRGEPDPNVWLLGCKEAIMVLDGDEGRRLRRRGKPLTKLAKEEKKRLSHLPIDLRILERYGIENYFTQEALEKVIGTDLSSYFPIPDYVSVVEHLSKSGKSWTFQLRKFVAKCFGLAQPSPIQALYAKKRNAETAQHLTLDDVRNTDLFKVVQDIHDTWTRMAAE
jgi:hypothetical protein